MLLRQNLNSKKAGRSPASAALRLCAVAPRLRFRLRPHVSPPSVTRFQPKALPLQGESLDTAASSRGSLFDQCSLLRSARSALLLPLSLHSHPSSSDQRARDTTRRLLQSTHHTCANSDGSRCSLMGATGTAAQCCKPPLLTTGRPRARDCDSRPVSSSATA